MGASTAGGQEAAPNAKELQATGKLDWKDTVGKHLPQFPNAAIRDQVTLHHIDFRIAAFAPAGLLRHAFPADAVGTAPGIAEHAEWSGATADDVETAVHLPAARHRAPGPRRMLEDALPFHFTAPARRST